MIVALLHMYDCTLGDVMERRAVQDKRANCARIWFDALTGDA